MIKPPTKCFLINWFRRAFTCKCANHLHFRFVGEASELRPRVHVKGNGGTQSGIDLNKEIDIQEDQN